MRCPHCGTNRADPDTACPGCGAAPPRPARTRASVPPARALPQTPPQTQWLAASPWLQQPPATVAPSRLTTISPAVSAPGRAGAWQGGDLCGHVLVVEHGQPAPPSFNVCLLLSRLVWLMVWLLVSVLAALAMVLLLLKTASGFGALVFLTAAFFGVKFLLGLLMPGNLLSLFRLHSRLNPFARRRHEEVPVCFIRVRTHGGGETEVRLLGRLALGNVRMDDWMTFWGRWRGGMLDARRAWNHRTGAWVALHQTQSWGGLAIALMALLVVLACLVLMVASLAPPEPSTFPRVAW